MVNQLKHKSIADIVSRHYIFAYILYYYGIEFFDHINKTLEELCIEQDLDISKIMESFEMIYDETGPEKIKLDELPIELVVDFLRHSHQVILEQRIPFIAHLIERLMIRGWNSHLIKELKQQFPAFIKEITAHIQIEQNIVFAHIIFLTHYYDRVSDLYPVFSMLNDFSIRKYAKQHLLNDSDHLNKIRTLTNDYSLWDNKDIQMKIIMEELRSFDRELSIHAKIENHILFPKSINQEKEVWSLVQEKAAMN